MAERQEPVLVYNRIQANLRNSRWLVAAVPLLMLPFGAGLAQYLMPWVLMFLVPVIASGGVGNLDHMVDGIREGHATAVLAASIFHFGEFTIRQAKDHMIRAGLAVRLDP